MVAGCGDGQPSSSGMGAAGGDAQSTGAGGSPAFVPVLPQVVDLGGPIVAAPKVQLIVYPGDGATADIEAFLQELTQTSYWSDVTGEYGVGPLTILPPITLATAAPKTITDDTLRANLAANTTGSNPPWGAADPDTIYLFAFPPGTAETDGTFSGCNDFDGYHDAAPVGTINVPYAVTCACPGFDGPQVTDTQERTVAISHELVEAATNPLPFINPAYGQTDDADIVWMLVTDGELADMCEFDDDANYVPPDATYMIQRIWSNAAARSLANPCLPHTNGAPYLNSFPALGQIRYDIGDGPFTTNGVSIPIGSSKTIDVNLFSAATLAAPWSLAVYDYDELFGKKPGLTVKLDKDSGGSGDVLHLTITPIKADQMLGGEAFVIFSDYGLPGDPDFQSEISMGLVTN